MSWLIKIHIKLFTLAFVVFCLSPGTLTEAYAVDTDINVFILHSYNQEYPWTKQENSGIINTLNSLFEGKNVSYSTEYLDSKRVDLNDDYQSFFLNYLQQKYKDYIPDIVFLSDDNALKFMWRFHRDLFSSVPVVFCGVNDASVAEQLRDTRFRGVFEVKDVSANLRLINKLLPEHKTVTFIGDDSTTYKAIHQSIQSQSLETLSETRIEFVAAMNISTVLQQLQVRQKGLLILTTVGGFTDERGKTISISQVIKRLCSSGEFVIISMEDVYMHEGVLGGIVTSGRAQGAAAAKMGHALLTDKGQEITSQFSNGPNIPTFNYVEMAKLGLSTQSLPSDSEILGKPLSLYDEFSEIIQISIGAFVVMLILLVFLSLSVVRRKKAESDLQANENFLTSVLDNLPDMVFVKDAKDLRFVRLNTAGETIFGESQDNVIGKNDFDFFPKEEADFFTKKDRQTLENKVLVDIPEEPIHTPDGVRFLHTKKIPILDTSGNPTYLLGISRDITELINARQKRRELEDKLKQAQKMESIGTLAGGIAHDFNNILSSIIGYTELAQRQSTNPEVVEKLLNGALKGTERAKQLVRQILTFSRKGVSERVPVVLADVIKEGLNLLRSSLPSTITIQESLTSRSCVHADPTQMHQIIMNLGTNGYQAMLDKGGTLVVRLDEEEINTQGNANILGIEPGWYLHLSIRDTGRGMDKKTLERMFDPYFTTKGPESGTGLGLAVVHGIVKNHGGYVSVVSEPEIGTTVDIYLPVTTSDSSVTLGSKTKHDVTGGSESILLVDDEQDIVTMAASHLTSHGYRVTSFTSSLEALLEFKKNPDTYDLLITDMTMPRMTGTELAEAIFQVTPHFPVMLCTGHSDNVDRNKALSMGIRAYCEKPMNLDEMLITIRQTLDNK